MNELQDVAKSLIDVDGSCRDLNFESPTWTGVDAALEYLVHTFETGEVTDADGTAVRGPLTKSIRTLGGVGGRVVLEGSIEFVRHLQVFVHREDDGSAFVELTFFP